MSEWNEETRARLEKRRDRYAMDDGRIFSDGDLATTLAEIERLEISVEANQFSREAFVTVDNERKRAEAKLARGRSRACRGACPTDR